MKRPFHFKVRGGLERFGGLRDRTGGVIRQPESESTSIDRGSFISIVRKYVHLNLPMYV